MATMLMDYQSLMVTHVNTSGHLLMDYMIIVQHQTTVHVLLPPGSEYPSPPFVGTVNQEALTLGIFLPTTSMTHCGTDLVASL